MGGEERPTDEGTGTGMGPGYPFDIRGLGAWGALPFFQSDALDKIAACTGPSLLPPPKDTFAALRLTPPETVRVVILGQDPYPTPGHANGLAFSVAPGTPLPRSLVNIFVELHHDVGAHPTTGDLGGWARQGVLLLNTALSTAPGAAGSHARVGWAALTRQVLNRLEDSPRAYILWGRHAQGFAPPNQNPRDAHPANLVIKSPHPSPLSARRGFFGSKPFSQVNKWLKSRGESTIDWAADA